VNAGRKHALRVLILALLVLVAVVVEGRLHDPLDAARAKAIELGVDMERAQVTSGRHGTRWLSSYGGA